MYNPNIYNRDYIKATLGAIKDNLDDVEKWSVCNDDKANEEIKKLIEAFDMVNDTLLS